LKLPKILSRIFNPRASPRNGFWSNPYRFFFGSTTSGKSVNEITAMQTSAVYACVRILAETIASLPLHTYKYTDKGKEKALEHDLYHLLHDEPNSEMTSFTFREVMMTHLLLWGNAYSQIIRDGRNKILGLYPLLPDKMRVERDINGNIFYIYNKCGEFYSLRSDEVLHIPGLGFNGLIGYSPIAMAKNAIGASIAMEEYGSKFFSNGANPGGILEHPGILKDPAKVRESWNSVYQGSSNSHRIAVLEEGMKFTSIGIPPEQSQFLESRKFQISEIARIFRVPLHMIGDLERATFSNIENQSLEFVMYTLDCWLVRWEQAIKKALFTKEEKKKYFVKFNVSALMRGDFCSRMQGYATGIQNGFLSPDDVRELEDMNKIENGNIYCMNGNMLKLEDVGAFYVE
jgi:HK97 family phage portal protein